MPAPSTTRASMSTSIPPNPAPFDAQPKAPLMRRSSWMAVCTAGRKASVASPSGVRYGSIGTYRACLHRKRAVGYDLPKVGWRCGRRCRCTRRWRSGCESEAVAGSERRYRRKLRFVQQQPPRHPSPFHFDGIRAIRTFRSTAMLDRRPSPSVEPTALRCALGDDDKARCSAPREASLVAGGRFQPRPPPPLSTAFASSKPLGPA
ncbi:hypothetical protein BJ912DRAFT_971814 [Pholiota molesta]|nr:hypothetical protein BJ912DRAFT_971814 [Pholiota molesta]